MFTRIYLWGRSLRIRHTRRRRGDREYDLLPMLVKPGKIAIDIGANRGVYTIPLAARASRVIAYEPSPWIADYLARGMPANVEVRQAAVSDTPGEVTLRVPVRADGSLAHNQGSIERYDDAGTKAAQVKCVRLDDEGIGPCGFIKIDAEDHEIPVVRGAREIILRDRPNMLIEVLGFADNPRWDPLYRELKGLGYEAYVLHNGALELATTAALAKHGNVGLNLVCLPVAS